jgi:hypothetical protein
MSIGPAHPLQYNRHTSGLVGEIQVNSPEMIYPKEPAPIARNILGDAEYDAIASRTSVPGGQGHALYEEYRQLPPIARKPVGSPRVAVLQRHSVGVVGRRSLDGGFCSRG